MAKLTPKSRPQAFRVTAVQFEIFSDDPENNSIRLTKACHRLPKTDLILVPEMFLGSPKDKSELKSYTQIYQQSLKELGQIAKNKSCHIFGSILENDNGKTYNTAIWISPNGDLSGTYRKMHLFRLDGEHRTFSAGTQNLPIWKMPWGPTSPVVCYDLRFPELLRQATFAGTKFFLVCAQWPDIRREHWLSLLKVRAIENQAFILSCNRRGKRNGKDYSGNSAFFSPWGECFSGPSRAKSLSASFSPIEVDKIRVQYPFLSDARARITF